MPYIKGIENLGKKNAKMSGEMYEQADSASVVVTVRDGYKKGIFM